MRSGEIDKLHPTRKGAEGDRIAGDRGGRRTHRAGHARTEHREGWEFFLPRLGELFASRASG